jgi:hypothetical protein
MNRYLPLLNVYVIWHPDADARCRPLAESLYTSLNRNPAKPFAPGIGIPVYFRCRAEAGKEVPLAIDVDAAEHTVIFVLVEDNLVVADESWKDYVAEIYTQILTGNESHLFVPIALTKSAVNLHPAIAEANFVRLFDLDADTVKAKLIHYATHALAQLLENTQPEEEAGIKLSPLPIKLFISHTKRETKSLKLATELKQAVDNTQMARFFDTVDIASGAKFDEVIENNIKRSALIAIRTDRYTESPWCRMEIITAKRYDRPIIVVDALQRQEDRSLPYLSNIPSIRYDPDKELTVKENQKALQAIIDFALIEVLRFIYIKNYFVHLSKRQWLPQGVQFLSRPPEERDLKKCQSKLIIYPDPPLGYEEFSELSQYQILLSTPTTYRGKSLQGWSIGLSISESDPNVMQTLGLGECHLQNAMLEIARHCLAQGAALVYGGDLRPNGFTENLLELVRYHNDALQKEFNPIVNYLAWPLLPKLDVAWQANNSDALIIKKIDAPIDLKAAGLIQEIPTAGNIGTIPSYVWARCLTAMRKEIVQHTRARIMLGGKTLGYKGKYPGLVEEALLTLKAGKPLYLLGGYGGAARAIIEALQGRQPKALTQAYQCADPQYAALLEEFNRKIAEQPIEEDPIDYDTLVQTFAAIGIKGLNNGLDDQENQALFATIHLEEAIILILTGLSRIETC